jgi:hypothetical protein
VWTGRRAGAALGKCAEGVVRCVTIIVDAVAAAVLVANDEMMTMML